MGDEEEVPAAPKLPKCLIVTTSAETYPDGETPSGLWISEAAEPAMEFVKQGWEVAYASIAGTTVADPASIEAADAATKTWWEENKASVMESTKVADIPPESVADYEAIFLSGGSGTMFDFKDCAELQALIKGFYEADKVVAAVCHGPVGLVNVVLSDETKVRHAQIFFHHRRCDASVHSYCARHC